MTVREGDVMMEAEVQQMEIRRDYAAYFENGGRDHEPGNVESLRS